MYLPKDKFKLDFTHFYLYYHMKHANVFFLKSLALVPSDSYEDLPCLLDIDMFHLLVGIWQSV
jgi:hypothetical protein